MQIKTTMLCHLTTTRTAVIKKFTNSKSWRGCRVGEPSYTVGENVNWQSYCGEQHKGFLKINMFWGVLSRWKRNEMKPSTPSPPLHKYIKNTSACGTTPTEHLLKKWQIIGLQKGKLISIESVCEFLGCSCLLSPASICLGVFFCPYFFYLYDFRVFFCFSFLSSISFFLFLFCGIWLVES